MFSKSFDPPPESFAITAATTDVTIASCSRVTETPDVLNPSITRLHIIVIVSMFIVFRFTVKARHQRLPDSISGANDKVVVLPCGHYTMGESPFKFMDGYHIINFLKRNL